MPRPPSCTTTLNGEWRQMFLLLCPVSGGHRTAHRISTPPLGAVGLALLLSNTTHYYMLWMLLFGGYIPQLHLAACHTLTYEVVPYVDML